MVTFAFTFRTLAVLSQSTDMEKFDDLSGFEQIPLLLFAALVASGKNDLPEGFDLEQMDDFLFTMDPSDVAEVFEHGSEAMGFIGLTMTAIVKTAKAVKAGQKPAKARKETIKIG